MERALNRESTRVGTGNVIWSSHFCGLGFPSGPWRHQAEGPSGPSSSLSLSWKSVLDPYSHPN